MIRLGSNRDIAGIYVISKRTAVITITNGKVARKIVINDCLKRKRATNRFIPIGGVR